jgi:predicted transcriptional regulator of viral defense system
MMDNSYITVARVQNALGVTQPGALALLRRIEQRGWLEDRGTSGGHGRVVWVAPEVLSVIEEKPPVLP